MNKRKVAELKRQLERDHATLEGERRKLMRQQGHVNEAQRVVHATNTALARAMETREQKRIREANEAAYHASFMGDDDDQY